MQIPFLKLFRPNLIRPISTAALPKAFSRPVIIPNDAYLLSSMVEEFASSGRLNDAIVLMFEATKKFDQPIVPWNILFTHVTSQKKLKLAIKLFNEAIEVDKIYPFLPRFFNSAKMKVRGVKPNERTYTILLSGCASSPAPTAHQKAEKILAEMKRVASNKAAKGASPVFQKLAEPLQSTRIIYENSPLPDLKDPSTIHYNNLLKVYSRQKKLVEMIKLYDSMCNRTKIPDHEYSPEACDGSAAPVKPDIITYTIVANNLSLLKTDEGFRQALTIWQDLRDDVEAHPDAGQMLIFDDRFLQALVNGSLYCKDKELLLKGLELIDKACDLKLGVEYPTTPSYLELPSLNEREQDQVSRCLREDPRPHILDLALRSISILGFHHLASKVFFSLVKPNNTADTSRIEPDMKHFALVLASICDNSRAIFQQLRK